MHIPITLLTGFLGSGKTTVLNHLVRQPELARTLVIVNEFGEVGLDHLLMSRVPDDAVVEMSSGCLCCTVRGDLVSTLKNAHWRYARAGERQFDRVVIETTGLADPAPILQTLMTVGVITRRYRLDGVVTVVDLANAAATLDAHPEAVKQAAVADRLLLTKGDLADSEARLGLARRLVAINPGAAQVPADHGAVDPAAVLGLGPFQPEAKSADVAHWLSAEAYGAGGRAGGAAAAQDREHQDDEAPDHAHVDDAHDGHTHHDHAPGHDHDPNRHDDRIRAFCILRDAPLAADAPERLMQALGELAGPDLLRVKGMLSVQGRAGPVVIHGVQHSLSKPVELAAWPGPDRRSRLVFITRDIPQSAIAARLGTLEA
ncbi:GTP-binding protein [Thiohalocapsa halophila]|uniref:GTP-binding protein n=1 Tax=Thiohalocapsa halophila TaxID=69359 RepID=A0ABS1CMI9_9GAMM|nr:GTP-binding protein [Thiohalocapsa halophila]MBK1633059.1 GTP-binding protein [Thiohalocapsa halophila]